MTMIHAVFSPRPLAVSVMCVLLSACGGSDNSPTQSTPQVEQAVTPSAPTVAVPQIQDTTVPNTGGQTPQTATTTQTSNEPTKKPAVDKTAEKVTDLAVHKSTLHKSTFIEQSKLGMTKMKRYHEGYNRGAFDGTMLTINNNTGAIQGAPTPNLDFEFFRVNGTRMILLQRLDDKLKSIPLRKLTKLDFPEGGFSPKDPANPGYIGSSYGNSQGKGVDSLKSFGQVRFGVYTDNTNTSHLFVHGNPSARSFSGIFRGSAIIGKDGNYRGLPKAVTAYLNKDFTKLDVAIQTDKTLLKFGADVNYDHKTFNGDKNGVQTYGGLFGTDGLGGFFDVKEGVHKGEHGVFGASNGKDIVEDYKQ